MRSSFLPKNDAHDAGSVNRRECVRKSCRTPLSVSSGPVVGLGEGPDAFRSPASQHMRDLEARELGRLIDELWNDLARAVASARNRALPARTP